MCRGIDLPFEDPAGPTRRAALNPLLLTINAYLKIEFHNAKYASQFPSQTLKIVDLVKKLNKLIYFLPNPQPGSIGQALDEAEQLEEAAQLKRKREKKSEDTHHPVARSRRSSPLASGSESQAGGDGTNAQPTPDNLSQLEDFFAEQEVKMAADLLNNPKTPIGEQMALSFWFFSPNRTSPPLSQTTSYAHTLSNAAGKYAPDTDGMVAARSRVLYG
jgi:hypothetical protein